MQRLAPVAVALDAPDIDVAAHWATLVTPHVSTVKIGLELYLRYGPAVVATVRGERGPGLPRPQAARHPQHRGGSSPCGGQAAPGDPHRPRGGRCGHDQGGRARRSGHARRGGDPADLDRRQRPRRTRHGGSVSDAVRRMAALAVTAGARASSARPRRWRPSAPRSAPASCSITPGIRPAGATSDDQARIATPLEAMKAGADLLVIGRPITKAADPGAAAAAMRPPTPRGVAVLPAGCISRAPRAVISGSAAVRTARYARLAGNATLMSAALAWNIRSMRKISTCYACLLSTSAVSKIIC